MKVVFTPTSKSDLREIAFFIGRRDPIRARSFMAELRAAALEIGVNPLGYPVSQRFSQNDVGQRPHRRCLILYRVRANHVTILQILHSARDLEALAEAPADEAG